VRFFKCLAVLLLLVGMISMGHGQEPSLAPDNIEFTKKIVAKFHYVAWVDVEWEENKVTHYQYDHYPGKERLKTAEGVFVRLDDKGWGKSDDWGETGTPVEPGLADQLDMDVKIVQVQFAPHTDKDASQGGPVWKSIEKTNDKTFIYYTYERSREHPNLDGVYPRFTFMKAEGDIDGQLFLCKSTGQLRSGDRSIPFTVKLDYLVPIAPGTKVEVFDKVTGKKKVQLVTEKDSGWEITTPRSAPPAH
jgi:hypothetical protein